MTNLDKSCGTLSNYVKSCQTMSKILSNLNKSCQILPILVKSCQILSICPILSSLRGLILSVFIVLLQFLCYSCQILNTGACILLNSPLTPNTLRLFRMKHTVKPRNLRPRSLRTPQICSWYFVPTPSNLLSNFRKFADFFF